MQVSARVGPTSTYTGFAPGCAGSLQPTPLVPRDTPRIGDTLQVRLFNLPADAAFFALGWQRVTPIDLGVLGASGCQWHTSVDAAVLLTGQNGQAVFELPIPDVIALVGTRFYNQAIVLDPTGNPLGAVTSDAAEGVVGHW